MTAHSMRQSTSQSHGRPTLTDLRDATLASRDAIVEAAATVRSPTSIDALSRQAQEQSRIAECLGAHIALQHDCEGVRDASAMAVLLEAILESRRSYKLAMVLARNELLPVLRQSS